MPFELRVDASELEDLGRRLRTSGDRVIRTETIRGLKAATKPLIPALRAAALGKLPKRGGLAAHVASARFSSQVRLTGPSVRVRIKASKAGTNLEFIDRGRLRKPLFGDREHWYDQPIDSGWWTDTLRGKGVRLVRVEIHKVVRSMTRRLESGG